MVLSTAKVLGLLGGHCCLFLFVGPLRVCCIKHFRWRFFDPAKVLVEALFFSLLLLLLLVFRVRSFGPEVQLMGVSNGFDQLLFLYEHFTPCTSGLEGKMVQEGRHRKGLTG